MNTTIKNTQYISLGKLECTVVHDHGTQCDIQSVLCKALFLNGFLNCRKPVFTINPLYFNTLQRHREIVEEAFSTASRLLASTGLQVVEINDVFVH